MRQVPLDPFLNRAKNTISELRKTEGLLGSARI